MGIGNSDELWLGICLRICNYLYTFEVGPLTGAWQLTTMTYEIEEEASNLSTAVHVQMHANCQFT